MSVNVPASGFVVHVTLPGKAEVTIDGRVGKMIEWAIEQRDRIEAMPFGSVTFDVGPNSFQPEIRRAFPRVTTPREPE